MLSKHTYKFFIGLFLSSLFLFSCAPVKKAVLVQPQNPSKGKTLAIDNMGFHTAKHGEVFKLQPRISGNYSICRKDMGHDDVTVDSETGEIRWDTSKLKFGRGFYIRIKCSNINESVFASTVVHVDKSGGSRIRVAGQEGISPYIGEAGEQIDSGDTLIIPDGVYPVSVNRKYQNAFKNRAPVSGTKDQFTTLIAETPGGVVISGAANDDWPKQKNAFQLSESFFVALSGFIVKDVQRSSFTTNGPGNYLLIDFIGTAGAGTWLMPCSNFKEARSGKCSNVGLRVNRGNPLIQNAFNWGMNRYGIMTRSTNGSITRRSFVRLDEHRGDQPYGGFSNYCDKAHLSQDNTVFDSLAIAAPHYKNYAGLEAYPATGCERDEAELKTSGLFSVNNDLSLSLMDQKSGPVHVWEHIVSYDSEGTCTPQKNYCATWLLSADKRTKVTQSYFGKVRPFDSQKSRRSRPFDTKDVEVDGSVVLWDIPGTADRGEALTYLPKPLLYFRGRSDTFYNDKGFDELTNERRWPIGGEDIIASNMRSYSNPEALKVGGGTVNIEGNRGAASSKHTMSEYFWSYIEAKIPPLVVRVKDKKSSHRISWEPFSQERQERVNGWNLFCMDQNESLIATVNKEQIVFETSNKDCNSYAVQAVYSDGVSGFAYIEKPE